MSIPSFKMTPARFDKLLNYYQCKQIDSGCSPKKARKQASKTIREAKINGMIDRMYYSLVKFGHIFDSDIFNQGSADQVIQSRSIVDTPSATLSTRRHSDSFTQAPVSPSKGRKKKIGRLISFDPDILQELIQLAESRDCSYASIVRQAVYEYLSCHH